MENVVSPTNRIAAYMESASTADQRHRIRRDEEDAPVFHRALGAITDQIGHHPGIAIGIAVTAGILLGWMVKRRRQ